MPRTVPELVRAHERLQHRCEEMRAQLDALRTQAHDLVSSFPSAGPGLVDPLAAVTDASDARVVTEEVPPRVVREPDEMGVTPRSRPLAGGMVVTGRVVSAIPQGALVAGTTVVDGPVRGRLPRPADDPKRDEREACEVLRARLMAMEATQTLLSVTRDELQEAQRERGGLEEELQSARAQLRDARAEVERLCAQARSDDPEEVPAVVQLSEARAEVHRLRDELQQRQTELEAALFHTVQLELAATESDRAAAFLRETNTHLEGQLSRLLTAMPMGPQPDSTPSRSQAGAPPATMTAAGNTVSNGGATPRAGVAPHRPQGAGGVGGGRGGGVTAEAYERRALERQVGELRGVVEKLQRRAEVNSEKRRGLEAAVETLTAENTELKASVLQYRRQINESELDAEREASARADAERAKAMEKELVRMRNVLRERRESFDAKLSALESRVAVLQKENSVYRAATAHTQRALLRAQLRLIMASARRSSTTMRDPPAGSRASEEPTPRDGSSDSANSPRRDVQTSPGAAASSPCEASAPPSPATPQARTHARATAAPAVPSDAVVSAAQPLGRGEALGEMRMLYERRMESLEAQRRAEVRQVQGLNRELRAALATLQEEVQEKARLLDLAHGQGGGIGGGGSGLLSTYATPGPAAGRASVASTPLSGPRGGWHRTASLTLPGGSVQHGLFSGDVSEAHGVAPVRGLSDIEGRYDPENMPVWEAVQVENEALLRRVSALQEEKWAGDSAMEGLRRQNATLRLELQRNADTMNQLLRAGVVSPAAMQRGPEEGRLRSLQCLLQETLSQKLALEEQVSALEQRLQRYA